MAKMNSTQAEAVLKSAGFDVAGFDWSAFNWAKFFEIVQALVALWKSQPQTFAAAQHEDHAACLKAHFDAITALSQCGSDCCGGP